MKVGLTSFVTIGFILLVFVCLTNSTKNAALNRRSITRASDASEEGLLKGGKNDESEEEETSSFPDDEKEGEVNGGESEESEEAEEEEEDGDVDDTSSSTGTEEEEEEGSSSENTDIGSSSDISSTSKDGRKEPSRNGGETNTSSNPKSSLLDEREKTSLRSSSSSSNDASKGRKKYSSSSLTDSSPLTKSSLLTKSSSLTNCSTDHLDLCSQSLLFYGDPTMNNLPETPLQVAKKCNDWRSSVKCSRDWSKKCLMDGTTAKLLVQSMITAPSKNVRERCSFDGTMWFLRSQRCIGIIRAEIETCLKRLRNGLSSILLETTTLKNQDWESRACCFFQQFNSCFDENLNKSCSEAGEEESVKYARRIHEANFGSFVDNFCAKKVISSGTPSISSSSSSNSFSSSLSKKCEEGLISKLSQITNPSSTGSSSSSSIIMVHGNESEKEKGTRSDSMEEESGTMMKKLMMNQKEEKTGISSSLLVMVIKLYQKFGLISNQDFVPS